MIHNIRRNLISHRENGKLIMMNVKSENFVKDRKNVGNKSFCYYPKI